MPTLPGCALTWQMMSFVPFFGPSRGTLPSSLGTLVGPRCSRRPPVLPHPTGQLFNF